MEYDRQGERVPFAPELSYHEVLESIREFAVFLVMPDSRIASWNRGVGQVFGYTKDEFIGLSSRMIFVPEDVEAGVPEMEMKAAARSGLAFDNRWHLRKDGSRFWANGVLTAIRGQDANVVAYVKVLSDKTAQKEAEEALKLAHAELEQRVAERTAELQATVEELRRSENLFAAIFRAGPFAATVLAPDGRFLEVNDAFCRLTGYAAEEVLGAAIDKVADWRSAGGQGAPERGAEESGFRDEELELRSRSGEVRTVLASEVQVPLDGKYGSLVMFFDITDRKRTEDELMQAIQDVMQDASWFSRSVVERLAEIRGGRVDSSRVGELTRREREVLEGVARGHSNARIAEGMGIAPQTVRNYITSVYEKIGVTSRVEAVVWARERGLGL